MADPDEAVAVCFVVKIDNDSLGAFNSCEGLGCEVVMETREEGGNNGMVWQLPTRIRYSNIKLTRPVSQDSAKLMKMFAGLGRKAHRGTATIEARTLDGTVVARWSLVEVTPVRWTGPQLNPDSPKVATETLELAHHGFLSSDAAGR
jgi:phage tail-like protein